MKRIFFFCFSILILNSGLAQSLIPFLSNSKWGLKNLKSEIEIPALYDTIIKKEFTQESYAYYGDDIILAILDSNQNTVSLIDKKFIKEINYSKVYSFIKDFKKMKLANALDTIIIVYGKNVKLEKVFCYDSITKVSYKKEDYGEICDTIIGKKHIFPKTGNFYIYNGKMKPVINLSFENLAFMMGHYNIENDLDPVFYRFVFTGLKLINFTGQYIELKNNKDYFKKHQNCFFDDNHIIDCKSILYKKNGKWGIIHWDGTELVSAEYDSIFFDRFDFVLITNNVLGGYYSLSDQKLIYKAPLKHVIKANINSELFFNNTISSNFISNEELIKNSLFLYFYDTERYFVNIIDSFPSLDSNGVYIKNRKHTNKISYYKNGKIRLVHYPEGLISKKYFDNIYIKYYKKTKKFEIDPFSSDTIFSGYNIIKDSTKWIPIITAEEKVINNKDYLIIKSNEIIGNEIIVVRKKKYYLIKVNEKYEFEISPIKKEDLKILFN